MTTMKEAIVGTDISVKVHDVPIPEPGPDQILIKVVYAGLSIPSPLNAIITNIQKEPTPKIGKSQFGSTKNQTLVMMSPAPSPNSVQMSMDSKRVIV